MVAMLETVGAVGGTSLNYQPEQRCGEPNSLHRPDGRVSYMYMYKLSRLIA